MIYGHGLQLTRKCSLHANQKVVNALARLPVTPPPFVAWNNGKAPAGERGLIIFDIPIVSVSIAADSPHLRRVYYELRSDLASDCALMTHILGVTDANDPNVVFSNLQRYATVKATLLHWKR
jgi:hypothetical protein